MSLELITENLNPQQHEAVTSEESALLVLAGAGSGKTSVLTRRISYLLAKGEISPQEFLAVTFTNKAAFEMKERIIDMLTSLGFPPPPDMWVSTFHSMGAKILREHIHLLDYPTSFTIYDGDDQLKVIKGILKDLNIDTKTVNPKSIRESISKAKSDCIYPHETEKLEIFWVLKFQEIYTRYEKKLFESNALDFSDLLFKTYDLLLSYPEILELYKNKFKHILVDEYQDTNALQYKLIKLLAHNSAKIFVVGDEDQSIYSWRGADARNINQVERDFHTYKIKLEQNYRSTDNIVKASNAVIKNNTLRNEKTLRTDNPTGEKINLLTASNEYEEARLIATGVENLINSGSDPDDIAIFYRLNSQSRVVEDQLRMKSIPYKILGGLRFYERKEIKDILAFMKLTINPLDEISLLRVINVPARGIGKKTIENLFEYARAQNISAFKALEELETTPFLKPSPRKKLLAFYGILKSLQKRKEDPVTEVYREILDLTGYVLHLKAQNNSEADARIDNLEELDNALSHFQQERGEEATLTQFLEETALISDADNDEVSSQVTLMTLHVSKGLEYEHVFIVGIEEGLLPCVRSEDTNEEFLEVEEERRLMYVGMTRAKQNLTLSFAKSRKVWGQEQRNEKSRFLDEIPKIYLNISVVSDSSWRNKRTKSYKKELEFPDYENEYAEDATVDYFDEDSNGLQQGHKVRHPVFGLGSVLEIEGSGELMKVKILFNDKSVKKFVAKYARLEKIY